MLPTIVLIVPFQSLDGLSLSCDKEEMIFYSFFYISTIDWICPPKFICWNLIANVLIFGDGAFKGG